MTCMSLAVVSLLLLSAATSYVTSSRQLGFSVSAYPDIPRPFYELFPGLGYLKLHTNGKPWHEAKRICEKEGAHLAIIDSEKVIEALVELRRRLPNVNGNWMDNYLWIGYHDNAQEGVWETIYGKPMNKTAIKWKLNEPNGGNVANCGNFVVTEGTLNDDIICDRDFGFYCQLETY